ncbi:MAG: FliM/FliN family flagellar motor switch protein [Sandaracinaceae bacterium]
MSMDLEQDEPLLSDEETSALLDAMREEERRGEPEAKATDLGSPEGPLRDALGRADAAGAELASTARSQLLRQIARGVEVEVLPAEIVPRDVLVGSIDPRAVRYSLTAKGDVLGQLVVDSSLTRFVLERCMGAPEQDDNGVFPSSFSGLDRRILAPFPAAIVRALSSSFLAGRALTLSPHADTDDVGSVRFEPMLRMGIRITSGGSRAGELVVALGAAAVGSSSPQSQSDEARLRNSAPDPRTVLAQRLTAAEVDLTAVLGRAASSVRQLISLGEGDVLRLDGAPGEPVQLCVEDVVVAQGSPVVAHGDLAVEVLHRV